jgi:hypothetical protein
MRFMFVYWKLDDAGSAQTIYNYHLAAQKMGHEVFLYAPEDPAYYIPCSLDIESADAVIFVMEWNIYLHNNLPLDLETPTRRTERKLRIIIDNDGMYNDLVRVDGDFNHMEATDARRRTELYDSISDRIYQPTFHPERENVGTFLFHGYDAAWEMPLDFRNKEYGMFYVGSNWFRWRAMKRVLGAIEPIRGKVGRIGIVGHNWLEPPAGAESPLREQAYGTDPEYLRRLGIEVGAAVPIDQVISTMSKGIFSPVLVRPVFNHFRLVNPRLFETPAANTIPLFCLDKEYVREIYGDRGLELALGKNPTAKIQDVLTRPDYYATVIKDIRRHVLAKHSFAARLQDLIDLVRD